MGFLGNMFQGWHLLLILLVILLLFGAAKLPALAKSLGQSARVFKGEMKAMKDDQPADGDSTTGENGAEAVASQESAPSARDTSPPQNTGTSA